MISYIALQRSTETGQRSLEIFPQHTPTASLYFFELSLKKVPIKTTPLQILLRCNTPKRQGGERKLSFLPMTAPMKGKQWLRRPRLPGWSTTSCCTKHSVLISTSFIPSSPKVALRYNLPEIATLTRHNLLCLPEPLENKQNNKLTQIERDKSRMNWRLGRRR